MEHLVRYRTNAGETRYEQAGSLEAAVSLVERLRNEDNASEVQVFRPVPIEFKAYYKVVVAEDEQPEAAAPDRPAAVSEVPPPGAMPLTPPRPAVQVHDGPKLEDGDAAPSDDEGAKKSLFSRGG